MRRMRAAKAFADGSCPGMPVTTPANSNPKPRAK
jgi:hypothetical protein